MRRNPNENQEKKQKKMETQRLPHPSPVKKQIKKPHFTVSI